MRAATASLDLTPYTGRFITLWGVFDVVALGGQLWSLAPTLDDPVAVAQRLEVVDADTLRIAEGPGYGSPGERYVYERDGDGRVVAVRGGSGTTALPERGVPGPARRRGPHPPSAPNRAGDRRSPREHGWMSLRVPAPSWPTTLTAPPSPRARPLRGVRVAARARRASPLRSRSSPSRLRWRGSDLPAHFFRVALVERDGFEIWNNQWFGGHHTLGYGALFPVLGATFGIWPVAVASAAPSARSLADVLITRGLGRRCVPASLWFAAGTRDERGDRAAAVRPRPRHRARARSSPRRPGAPC